MKSPTDLFDLVKSLTPSEKGYFKKYVAKGDGKKYLKLFDAINAMEVYDEEKLKQKFKKELSNLSAAKNYLFEEVLEAVRAYQTNNSYTSQILRLTDQADLLYKRGLYEVARNKYAVAYQMAVDIQSYKHAIIPRWGFISCCYHTKRHDLLLSENEMIALDQKILDETWLDFGHQELSIMRAMYREKQGKPQTRDMLHDLINAEKAHFELVKQRTGDSEMGKMYDHWMEAGYALENSNRLAALRHRLAAFEIFGKYPMLRIADAEMYMMMLINLVTDYHRMYMEKEKNAVQDLIKKEMSHLKLYLPAHVKLSIESRYYQYALIDAVMNRPVHATDELFKEIFSWVKSSEGKLVVYNVGRFHLWQMEHLFLHGNYPQLVLKCNEFLYDKSIKYPLILRACALLIYLTVYLEQNDWDILPAKLKEAYKLLKEEETTSEPVLLVLRLVGQVIKEKKQFELKTTLRELQKELKDRRVEKEGAEVFFPFHFEAWIDSKLEGIPHKEAALRYFALSRNKVVEKIEEELRAENLTREDLQLPFMSNLRQMAEASAVNNN